MLLLLRLLRLLRLFLILQKAFQNPITLPLFAEAGLVHGRRISVLVVQVDCDGIGVT